MIFSPNWCYQPRLNIIFSPGSITGRLGITKWEQISLSQDLASLAISLYLYRSPLLIPSRPLIFLRSSSSLYFSSSPSPLPPCPPSYPPEGHRRRRQARPSRAKGGGRRGGPQAATGVAIARGVPRGGRPWWLRG